jgi:multiple sugar transport system substrate-binding protein
MGKKWLGVAVVCAMLFSIILSGCSVSKDNGSANGTTKEPASSAGIGSSSKENKGTITLLNAQDNGIRDKWLSDVIKPKFEAANPGIKLDIINSPYEQFDTKMSTMVAGGNPPDVWSHWGQSGFVDYKMRGLTLDITPYMKDFNNPNISESSLKIYNVEGKQYGIPLNIYSSMIFYNKSIFDKAGVKVEQYKFGDPAWTWDKLVELGKSVSKDFGKPTAIYGFTTSMGTHIATYSWDWGLDIYKDAYSSGLLTQANLTDPKFVEAVKFFQDLTFKHHIMPTTAVNDALTKTGDPIMTGKVAMTLSGSWKMGGFTENKINFGILPLPIGPAGTTTPFIYADPLMISSKSKNPEAAFKLVQFMTNPETQLEMVKTTGYPPADSFAYKEWFQQYKDFVDVAYLEEINAASIEHGKESPNHLIAGYSDITSFMKNEQQAILIKGDDPLKVLTAMQPKFQKLLDEIKQKRAPK